MLAEHFYQEAVEIGLGEVGQDDCRLIVADDRVAVAAFALKSLTQSHEQRFKRHLHTLDLQLGLLANFHDTRLQIHPVRIPR